MATALRLIYLVPDLGEYAIVPDGAVVNIGGVVGPNFTVGGKPLIFADGTTTDGSTTNIVAPDFQTVYQNSIGEAFIDFTAGKDLVLQALNNNQFRFDAETGNVYITGDLVVQGSTTTEIKASVNTDRVVIRQTSGGYTPFLMEPAPGVVPLVNLVEIKTARGGASVFTIGPNGQTYIQNLTTGLINGIDITALVASLNAHIETQSSNIKHPASQISVNTASSGAVKGNNVQEAIDSIATSVNTLLGRAVSDVQGFEHIQATKSQMWVINHGKNTRRVQVTVWDDSDEQVWADSVKIQNGNTVSIKFNTPMTGRAILMLF